MKKAIVHCEGDRWDGKVVEILEGPSENVWTIQRGREVRASFTQHLELLTEAATPRLISNWDEVHE